MMMEWCGICVYKARETWVSTACYWLVSVCPCGSKTHLPSAFPFPLFLPPPLPLHLLDFLHLAFIFQHGPHMQLGSLVHHLRKYVHCLHGTLCLGSLSLSVASLSLSLLFCMMRCQSSQSLLSQYWSAYPLLDGDDYLHAVH